MQIDRTTIQAAKDVFERLYGSLEGLGLSRQAVRDLVKYSKVPRWILKTDMQLANELTAIAAEFRKILGRVMKVYRTL